ncbi:unnamed protein product [Trichobilharzia szidati]|nr:unnamed protein product [Trichobilharzia szidati]
MNATVASQSNFDILQGHTEVLPRKCKVSSQILIKQHLDAHYRNIQSAKACIDNSTPYSYFSNPTTRGYRKSSRVHRRPLSSRPETNSFCNLAMVNTFSDDPEVDQIVRRFLLDGDEKYVEPLRFGEDQSLNAGGENACDKYSCVDGVSASIRRLEGDCYSNKTMQQRQSVSNDIMDIYHKKFTKPKPFSPRTIKSNASSKLIGLRCYNPPKRVVRVCQPDSKVILDVKPVIRLNRSNSQCTTDTKIKEKPVPKSVDANQDEVISSHLGKRLSRYASSSKNSNISPNMLSSSQKRVSLTNLQRNPISDGFIDRSQNFGKVNQWLNTLPGNSTIHKSETALPTSHAEDLQTIIPENEFIKDNVNPQMIDNSVEKEISVENLKNEMNYLKFISSVTEDVLTRGVLTDKNVNTILLEHATLNEYGLSTEQMRRAIQHIRSQLNITTEDATELTAGLSHVLDSNSPRLLLPYSQTHSKTGEQQSPLHQQSNQERQQHKQPTINYKTTMDIKSPSRATLPPPAPSKESFQPPYLRATVPITTTTTSVSIKPSENSHPLKNVKTELQQPVATQGAEQLRESNTFPSRSHNIPEVDRSLNQMPKDPSTLSARKQILSSRDYGDEKINQNLYDQEDTLNDQHAILDSSATNTSLRTITVTNTNSTEEINSLQTQNEATCNTVPGKDLKLTIEHAIDDIDPIDEEKQNTRQNRVKFASEAEFFSPSYYSEQTTSVSSVTDMTHASSTSVTNANTTNTDATASELFSSEEVVIVSPSRSPLQISDLNKQGDVNKMKSNEYKDTTENSDNGERNDKKEAEEEQEEETMYKEDFVSDCED